LNEFCFCAGIFGAGKEGVVFLRREWTLQSMTGAKTKPDAASSKKTKQKRGL